MVLNKELKKWVEAVASRVVIEALREEGRERTWKAYALCMLIFFEAGKQLDKKREEVKAC